MLAFLVTRFASIGTLAVLAVAIVPMSIAQSEPRLRVATPADLASVARALPRRAIVENLSVPLEELRITDLQGRDISREVDARTEGGKVTLNMAQPTPVVLKSKTVQTVAFPAGKKIVLPGGAVVPPASGAGGNVPSKAIWFRLTLAASPMPAPWDHKEGSYLTLLTFGLKRPDGAPADLSLDQPVIIKLAYEGLIAPEIAMISLDAPGLENEKTIPLRFTPQSAQPMLLVRSSITDTNIPLAALPRLNVTADRDAIVGLGLDTATVTITNIHPDGRNAAVEQLTPVSVSIEGGARVESPAVSIPAGEATTRFTVRSAGLSGITLRANANGIVGTTTFKQSFPVGPLVAAVLGGALGGFARRFVKGARRSSNQRRLVEGLVVALVVFVAGVLGVGYLSLPAAIVATEAGAFLTGVLGGFVGVSVLESLTKKNTRSADA